MANQPQTVVQPTREQLEARIRELESQMAAKTGGGIGIKIGEKGGVSVYGLGRYPLTLFCSQWVRLITAVPQVTRFLLANWNDPKMAHKDGDVELLAQLKASAK